MSEDQDRAYIASWRDLVPYGINCLTGERCSYSMRYLCDLNEDGVALLTSYFGLSSNPGFDEPWNRKVNDKPSLASVMLPISILMDLSVFIMFQKRGFRYAYVSLNGEITGTNEEYKDQDMFKARYINFSYVYSGPQRGGTNVHMMTGR